MITNGIKAAITLAFLAFCAGGIALFYSHMARTEAEESRNELRELERLGEFADRIREFEGDLREVAGDAGNFFERLDDIVGQTEDGFRRVAEQRQRMSENLSRLAETLQALEARIAHLEETVPLVEEEREAAVTDEPEIPGPVESGGEAAGDERVYLIRGGDTLSGVAREYGVPLNALLEANPDVDPNRLQIGQEIRIP